MANPPRPNIRHRPQPPSSTEAEQHHDYAVGYGKPPARNRFKPGQSGNPKGRPKGARSFNTMVRDLLEQKVAVRTDGKTRKVRRIEALMLKNLEIAAKGDLRALDRLFKLYMAAAPEPPPMSELPSDASSEHDQAILQAYAEMVIAQRTAGGE